MNSDMEKTIEKIARVLVPVSGAEFYEDTLARRETIKVLLQTLVSIIKSDIMENELNILKKF